MNQSEVREITALIAGLFPNVNEAISGALAQELTHGKYEHFRVSVWANAKRAETQFFNLNEMRDYFRVDQPICPREPDAATQAYRRQSEECNKGARYRGAAHEFVTKLPEEEFQALRAEVIAGMPEKIRPIAEKVGKYHGLITTAIFELVKKQSAGVA